MSQDYHSSPISPDRRFRDQGPCGPSGEVRGRSKTGPGRVVSESKEYPSRLPVVGVVVPRCKVWGRHWTSAKKWGASIWSPLVPECGPQVGPGAWVPCRTASDGTWTGRPVGSSLGPYLRTSAEGRCGDGTGAGETSRRDHSERGRDGAVRGAGSTWTQGDRLVWSAGSSETRAPQEHDGFCETRRTSRVPGPRDPSVPPRVSSSPGDGRHPVSPRRRGPPALPRRRRSGGRARRTGRETRVHVGHVVPAR